MHTMYVPMTTVLYKVCFCGWSVDNKYCNVLVHQPKALRTLDMYEFVTLTSKTRNLAPATRRDHYIFPRKLTDFHRRCIDMWLRHNSELTSQVLVDKLFRVFEVRVTNSYMSKVRKAWVGAQGHYSIYCQRHPSEFTPSLKHLLAKTYIVCMFRLHFISWKKIQIWSSLVEKKASHQQPSRHNSELTSQVLVDKLFRVFEVRVSNSYMSNVRKALGWCTRTLQYLLSTRLYCYIVSQAWRLTL
jgi:hypothetical protein